jgi:hypothetical protein
MEVSSPTLSIPWVFLIKILSPFIFCFIASFAALSFWTSIELLFLVYTTFKRYTGLYFWSIIVTTVAIIINTTALILRSFASRCCSPLFIALLVKLSWIGMVVGFPLVIWSRLHIVVNNPRILKYTLAMVIFNAVVWHSISLGIDYGLAFRHHKTYPVQKVIRYAGSVVFTLQDAIITSLYIYYTRRFLKSGYSIQTRKSIGLLLCVQVLVVTLDIAEIVLTYTQLILFASWLHPFAHSQKLKLEFIVLNQLLLLVRRGIAPCLSLGSNLPVQDTSSQSSSVRKNTNGQRTCRTHAGVLAAAEEVPPLVTVRTSISTPKIASAEIEVRRMEQTTPYGDTVLQAEECDSICVVGQCHRMNDSIDDLEAFYLGRWDNEITSGRN